VTTTTQFQFSQHCDPADFQCIKCQNDRIVGVIRSAGINFDPLLSETKHAQFLELTDLVRLNGVKVKECAAGLLTDKSANKWFYNPFIDGFQFEVGLGDCNMTSDMMKYEGDQYLKFTIDMEFLAQKVFGTNIFFGEIGHYKYNCFYRAATDHTETYGARLKRVGKEINQFVNWDKTVKFQFYQSEQYKKLLKPENLPMGSRVYLGAKWLENFRPSFPIVFYLPTCYIVNNDGTEKFPIVSRGALPTLCK